MSVRVNVRANVSIDRYTVGRLKKEAFLKGFIVRLTVITVLVISNCLYSVVSVYGQPPGFWPQPPDPSHPPVFICRKIHTYPHDPDAFTQGLVFEDGFFFEGTGLKGHSSLRKVVVETGRRVKMKTLPRHYFGEGITVFKDRIVQLTWKSRIGMVYNKNSFRTVDTFPWPGEGWGITTDGDHLIVSDGSDGLHFLDPDQYKIVQTLRVQDDQGPVTRLNELEYVQGYVLANIWQTDRIAVIAPDTGRVAAWISLDGLVTGPRRGVANGIAYDGIGGRLFVTGKRWPELYEVALVSRR